MRFTTYKIRFTTFSDAFRRSGRLGHPAGSTRERFPGVTGPTEGLAIGRVERRTAVAQLADVVGEQATTGRCADTCWPLAPLSGAGDDYRAPFPMLRRQVVWISDLRRVGGDQRRLASHEGRQTPESNAHQMPCAHKESARKEVTCRARYSDDDENMQLSVPDVNRLFSRCAVCLGKPL